jgi:hypothetical protein
MANDFVAEQWRSNGGATKMYVNENRSKPLKNKAELAAGSTRRSNAPAGGAMGSKSLIFMAEKGGRRSGATVSIEGGVAPPAAPLALKSGAERKNDIQSKIQKLS